MSFCRPKAAGARLGVIHYVFAGTFMGGKVVCVSDAPEAPP